MAPKRKRATRAQTADAQQTVDRSETTAHTVPPRAAAVHTVPSSVNMTQQQQQQTTNTNTNTNTTSSSTQLNKTHDNRQDQPTTEAAPHATSEPKKHAYAGELRSLMFGYGDAPQPRTETVEMLEDITLDYLRRVLRKAADAADERVRHAAARTGSQPPASARVRERDLLFVLRRDKRKLERVRELLEVWEEQKEARHGKAPEAYEKDDAEDDDPLAGV